MTVTVGSADIDALPEPLRGFVNVGAKAAVPLSFGAWTVASSVWLSLCVIGIIAMVCLDWLQLRKFVVPSTIFFLVYYFTLPVTVGYWPELMKREVIGVVNLAYLFALSQFLMTWTLAYLYMRLARRFDEMSDKVLADTMGAKGDE